MTKNNKDLLALSDENFSEKMLVYKKLLMFALGIKKLKFHEEPKYELLSKFLSKKLKFKATCLNIFQKC